MGLPHTKTAELKQQVFARHRQAAKRPKHGPKPTTIAAYVGVFLLIMSMVAIGYQPPQKTDGVASAVATQSSTNTQPSVDQLVATRIAAGVAERADLPIANNVANLSVSLSAESQLAQTDTNVISKPQIVQPSASSRKVRHYTAKAGDTVDKVAKQFGVSATTIKWANDLSSDALEVGRTLVIPPVDGVMYTVAAGDTVKSIASKYKADPESIVAFNDLELSGLKPDRKIIIPGGNLPADERPGYVAPVAQPSYTASSSYGYGIDPVLAGASNGNGYAFGNCTYYAYNRRVQLGLPVGSFWGNAATWAMYASAAGYRVDGSPSVGAIAQWNAYSNSSIGYYGHVGIVEQVYPDGSITISEMNNYAYGGFNVVDNRNGQHIYPGNGDWPSNFIH